MNFTFSEPQSISPRKKATTTVLSQPTLGKLPEPNYQNMEYKKLLIGKNEEDVEMAAERVTAHNASSEYKSKFENKNNIRKPTRPQRGSSSFHRKLVFCFSTIVAVLILITIISIAIWVMFIKKTETTNNTTTATIDASVTKTTTSTTSTTETTMRTTSTTSTNSHTTTMNVSIFEKWKQSAITVAGGNGQGQKLNQLSRPDGIFLDKNKNILIADSLNHRIVAWKYNAKKGQIIAGGNGQGNRMDQFNLPVDLIVDQQTYSIIIADFYNKRVIQWLNQKQQILIDNIGCNGLAMDKHGFLYVSDTAKNEVRRWKMGVYNDGIVVAGGNGKGNQLNQLDWPTYIFVDEDQSVYVSDQNNHRVMKWRKDAEEGTIVAGGNGKGANLNQLYLPQGVIADHLGQIYVADQSNHRVMRWCEGKEEGEIVVGGNDGGSESNQLNDPTGLSFDDERNLYVADWRNHRIQKYEIIL
ncbi:unnamed protein product [Adineta steineri]|uniref:NHL repeat containing protein n=2 Tax=Adineta steineri TaxID=433720 RepID=A0A813X5T4_9BILA|nr:unnamed protein product [Adineta steineri]